MNKRLGNLILPSRKSCNSANTQVLDSTYMVQSQGWFAATRAILETLCFVSGIVIAIAAVVALGQIRLTKQIAKSNARRESVRFAADLCKYFAEMVVPAWEAI